MEIKDINEVLNQFIKDTEEQFGSPWYALGYFQTVLTETIKNKLSETEQNILINDFKYWKENYERSHSK